MFYEKAQVYSQKRRGRKSGWKEGREGGEREMLQDFDTEIHLSMDLLDIYLYFDAKKYGTL